MKIKFLFNSFVPQKKCGADPASAILIGSAVTGGTGLLGNVLGSTVGYNQQSHMLNRQMDYQREENQVNRDWQTAEAEKNRSFQSAMLGQQNQLQMDLQEQAQKNNLALQAQQARYQSPVYQREQLSKAHLNPQVYFGSQSSFSGSSAPSAGIPSAPSAPHGSMVGSVGGLSPIGFQPTDLQIPSLLSGIGNLVSSVASARKAGVETKRLEESMYDYLSTQHEEAKQAMLNTDILKLHYAFQSSTLPDRVKKVEADLASTFAQCELLKAKGKTEESQQKLNAALENLDNALSKLHGEQYIQLKLLWPLTREKMESEIGLNRAKSNEANTQADVNKQLERFNKVVADIKESGSTAELTSLLKDYRSKGVISDADYEEAKRRLAVLDNVKGTEFLKKLDESLEWIKGKISIFH